MNKILILFSLFTFSLCANILSVIKKIEKEMPEKKNEIKKKKKNKSSPIYPIISSNYLRWGQHLQINYNPGIMAEFLGEFLNDVAVDYFNVEDFNITKKITNLLWFTKTTTLNKVTIPKAYYNPESSNKTNANFFVILTEKLGETIDFLLLNTQCPKLNSTDEFIGIKGDESNIWGSNEEIIVDRPENLTMDEFDDLFNYLQIFIFQQSKKIIDIIETFN
jgi:hypothetical protein